MTHAPDGFPHPTPLAAGTLEVASMERGWRLLAALVVIATTAAVCFFLGGFVFFAERVTGATPAPIVRADAIVVLTGGRDRVAAGMTLLAEARADRLLISGVHKDTDRRDIARTIQAETRLLDCCVDLGHVAANTTGNAEETADWVRGRDVRSVIVVTSAYHMPRSMAEMRALMPGVAFHPHPVHATDLSDWWADPAKARLLMMEYVKYIVAHARLGFDGTDQAKLARAGTAALR